jgi:hypothetical protein
MAHPSPELPRWQRPAVGGKGGAGFGQGFSAPSAPPRFHPHPSARRGWGLRGRGGGCFEFPVPGFQLGFQPGTAASGRRHREQPPQAADTCPFGGRPGRGFHVPSSLPVSAPLRRRPVSLAMVWAPGGPALTGSNPRATMTATSIAAERSRRGRLRRHPRDLRPAAKSQRG